MNIEEFREYCVSKPGVSESFPFDQNTLVFKVGGKMFVLVDVDIFESFNAKNAPDRNIELRELYTGITPGYHMSKVHWNTIKLDGSVPDKLIKELIDVSYQLVFSSLTKVIRESIKS
jgi:predicted DNA-binding protein (MmcQ/YjbR family)